MYHKSFSISKNAAGEDHAIYMQVFLSGKIFSTSLIKKEKKNLIKETPF